MKTLGSHHSKAELAAALGVSVSGFHRHQHKAGRPRRRRDAQLKVLVTESFTRSRRTYGSPRVRLDLADLGQRCVKNRIARLMRESGLRPCTTDSRHRHKVAENWLAKVPAPDRPGQVWQSDITYLETQEGWLYLAFTLDACSRRCIAHHCREDMHAALTTTTFDQAVRRQRPLAGLIHHSDRGSQYAATTFQERLGACRVTASMSRKGNPYDNALAKASSPPSRPNASVGSFLPRKPPHSSWSSTTSKPSTTVTADTARSATAHRSTSKNKCSPQTKTTNLNP